MSLRGDSGAIFERLKPPDGVRLWRYMNFTKYVAMLDSGGLYFARADKFADPFEGSLSPINVKLREAIPISDSAQAELSANVSRTYREMRRWMYINCWHESDYESAAMWSQYAGQRGAIAIETTAKNLREQLPEDVLLSRVAYHDYDASAIPEGNLFFPFLHKRKSFEHEHEVRAIRWKVPPVPAETAINFGADNPEEGVTVPVALASLIVFVHVSPSAPAWTLELVSNVTKRYGFSFPVTRSALDSAPVY
jgi:hypothetical protein